MRPILSLALLLTACSQPPAEQRLATGNFAGEGRDRLCLSGESGNYRAGLIAFGAGNVNCSASGRVELAGGGAVLIPRGEGTCRIPLAIQGDVVRIGEVATACSYYCGPGATMAGKVFNRSNIDATATDFAGDPLC